MNNDTMRALSFMLMIGGLLLTISTAYAEPKDDAWIVSPAQAHSMLEGALVLDTRGALKFGMGHIEGSQRAAWKDFSRSTKAKRGVLKPAESIASDLRELGVSNGRAVLVVGDPIGGWGEDGRIVWMLRSLGHQSSFLVDGGYDALKEKGAPLSRGLATKAAPGDFTPRPTDAYGAGPEDVQSAVGGPAHLIDTRETREYRGATPYGESRGGHVPGASHLYYKEFLNKDGRVLSESNVRERMKELGVGTDDDVIVYCTGGVRSAWLVVVLQHYGFDGARNYAGSMWDWAALDPEDHPLQKSK